MQTVCVYPGTFCPPTFGHLEIVKKAAEIFGEIYVICSANPDKEGTVLFSPEECREMWRFYDLPKGVRIATLGKFMEKEIDFSRVVMVRGVRDDRDFEYEKKVMMGNNRELGIDKFLVVVSDEKFKDISSTLARDLAAKGDTEELYRIVIREVAEKLIEKNIG